MQYLKVKFLTDFMRPPLSLLIDKESKVCDLCNNPVLTVSSDGSNVLLGVLLDPPSPYFCLIPLQFQAFSCFLGLIETASFQCQLPFPWAQPTTERCSCTEFPTKSTWLSAEEQHLQSVNASATRYSVLQKGTTAMLYLSQIITVKKLKKKSFHRKDSK